MGGTQWTTPAEKAFLKLNIKQYEEAQAKKKTSLWMSQLLIRFFDKFTDYSDGRNTTPREKVETRIRAWYNNHTGIRNREVAPPLRVAKIRTSGKAPREPLAPLILAQPTTAEAPRPKQKLQPIQAYSALHYRHGKYLKTLIDDEWEKIPDSEKYDANGQSRGPRLKHRNLRLEALFKAESQEIKDEVETYRNSKAAENTQSNSFLLPEEEDLDEEERNRIIQWRMVQRAIENLASTCEHVATALKKFTNGHVFLSVMANEPKRGGELAIVQFSAGNRISDGKDIFQAHPQAVTRFTNEMKIFTRSCTSKDSIDEMRLVYPQTAGAAIPTVADNEPGSSRVAPASAPITPSRQEQFPAAPPPKRNSDKDGATGKVTKPGYKWKQPRTTRFEDYDDEEDDEDKNGEDMDGGNYMDLDDQQEGIIDLDHQSLHHFDEDEDEETDDRFRDVVHTPRSGPSTLVSPALRIYGRKGGDGDGGMVLLEGDRWVYNYEYYRLENIERNNKLMEDLGIPDAVKAVVGDHVGRNPEHRLPRTPVNHGPPSRFPPPRASKDGDKVYVAPGPDELEASTTYSRRVSTSENNSSSVGERREAPVHTGSDNTPTRVEERHGGAPAPIPVRRDAPPPVEEQHGAPALVHAGNDNAPGRVEERRDATGPDQDRRSAPSSVDERREAPVHTGTNSAPARVEEHRDAPVPVGERSTPASIEDRREAPVHAGTNSAPARVEERRDAPVPVGERSTPASIEDRREAPVHAGTNSAPARVEERRDAPVPVGERCTAPVPSGNSTPTPEEDRPNVPARVEEHPNALVLSGQSSAPTSVQARRHAPGASEVIANEDKTLGPRLGAPDDDGEPASSPREKAKRASKLAKLNATGLVAGGGAIASGQPLSNLLSATANRVSITDIDVLSVPPAIQDHFNYLRISLPGSQETQLLLDWLTLECEDEKKVPSKLPVAKRPKSIVSWSRRAKQVFNDPPSFDVAVFAGEVRAWWTSLMPEWRNTDVGEPDWPLQRNAPDEESWKKVRKTGPNGFFLILLALSWWRARTTPGQPLRREYSSVLDDVAWVLGNIVKGLEPFLQRERPAHPTAPGPATNATNGPEAADQTNKAVTRGGRVSRPTKRKMGLSDVNPIHPEAEKRSRK